MKKKIARRAEIIIVGIFIAWGLWLLYMTQVPILVNGWKLRCLYGVKDSMSMAIDGKDGGIKPFQFYYIMASSSYLHGDYISFNNRHPVNSESMGLTMKRLYLIKDGWYYSHGLNQACSDKWYACRIEDIEGKVVRGPYPLLPIPESYWRWLSQKWTLNYNEIQHRQMEIWSWRSIFGLFSATGRDRNRILWERYGITSPISWDVCIPSITSFVVQSAGNRIVIAGEFRDWKGSAILFERNNLLFMAVIEEGSVTETLVINNWAFYSIIKAASEGKLYPTKEGYRDPFGNIVNISGADLIIETPFGTIANAPLDPEVAKVLDIKQ